MAKYEKEKIPAGVDPGQLLKRIKNLVMMGRCVEIREDPDVSGGLLLILWFDEHVDWSQHEDVS
jgi:hypothetical protein